MEKHSWRIFDDYWLEVEFQVDNFGYGHKVVKIKYKVFRYDYRNCVCLGAFAYEVYNMKCLKKQEVTEKIRRIIMNDLIDLYMDTCDKSYLIKIRELQRGIEYDEI